MPESSAINGFERLASYVNIAFIVFINMGWLGIIFSQDGWHRKMSLFYTFDISLRDVTVKHGAIVSTLAMVAEANKMPEKYKNELNMLIDTRCSIQEMRERMCALPQIGWDFCGMWSELQHASLIFMIVACVAIVIHLMGGGLIYWYWFVEARSKTRRVKIAFLVMPAVVHIANAFQYTLFTMHLMSFPPSTSNTTYSTCYFAMVMLAVLSAFPIAAALMTGRAMEEDLNEAKNEHSEFLKDQAAFGKYGGADCPGRKELGPGGFTTASPWTAAADPYTQWHDYERQWAPPPGGGLPPEAAAAHRTTAAAGPPHYPPRPHDAPCASAKVPAMEGY